MFMHDRKKAISTMMAKRSPKGEPLSGPTPMKPEMAHEEDGSVDGRHAAAEDIIAAHHEGSALKMTEALANFIDLHHTRNEVLHGEEET